MTEHTPDPLWSAPAAPTPMPPSLSIPPEMPEADWPGAGGPFVSPEPADPGWSAAERAPDAPLDPAAVTGPPWPRLVAGEGYVAPRLLRWPIVAGVVVLACWIAIQVVSTSALQSTTTNTAAPFSVSAADAQFTATFPGQPVRTEKTVGTIPAIIYGSTLSDHVIAVTYFALPSGTTFDLDAGISGAAAAQHGATVVSRARLTYQGRPAEDGVITRPGLFEQIRIVDFGSWAYLLEGVGKTPASLRDDYSTLLATFHPTTRVASARSSPTPPPASVAATPRQPAAAARPLAADIIPAPAGFATSTDPAAHNGKITAAAFDSTVAYNGAAADFQYVTGYQIEYDNMNSGDTVLVSLYQFETPQSAAQFTAGFTASTGEKSTNYPPITGAHTLDATKADSNGIFDHLIAADKNNTVMVIEEPNDTATRPAQLATLAQQQFGRI